MLLDKIRFRVWLLLWRILSPAFTIADSVGIWMIRVCKPSDRRSRKYYQICGVAMIWLDECERDPARKCFNFTKRWKDCSWFRCPCSHPTVVVSSTAVGYVSQIKWEKWKRKFWHFFVSNPSILVFLSVALLWKNYPVGTVPYIWWLRPIHPTHHWFTTTVPFRSIRKSCHTPATTFDGLSFFSISSRRF